VEEWKFAGRVVVERASCLFKGRGCIERKPDGVEGIDLVLFLPIHSRYELVGLLDLRDL
jgi:hypothetical protein